MLLTEHCPSRLNMPRRFLFEACSFMLCIATTRSVLVEVLSGPDVFIMMMVVDLMMMMMMLMMAMWNMMVKWMTVMMWMMKILTVMPMTMSRCQRQF